MRKEVRVELGSWCPSDLEGEYFFSQILDKLLCGKQYDYPKFYIDYSYPDRSITIFGIRDETKEEIEKREDEERSYEIQKEARKQALKIKKEIDEREEYERLKKKIEGICIQGSEK